MKCEVRSWWRWEWARGRIREKMSGDSKFEQQQRRRQKEQREGTTVQKHWQHQQHSSTTDNCSWIRIARWLCVRVSVTLSSSLIGNEKLKRVSGGAMTR